MCTMKGHKILIEAAETFNLSAQLLYQFMGYMGYVWESEMPYKSDNVDLQSTKLGQFVSILLNPTRQ